MVRAILQLEGAAIFGAALAFYFFEFEGSWWLFVLLLFSPDLSMVGYLRNVRVGAVTYNLAHNYVAAVAVMVIGLALDSSFVTSLGLVLVAHTGMDRALSYGLKYFTGFKDTHMQRV
ncbi:MAG: DUF4260 domain-containing protein [Chloroflexi bacterium]|nr:DUF4260 domain-containing protein [Chloroflexota bacterium]